jgi:hypothetical protein
MCFTDKGERKVKRSKDDPFLFRDKLIALASVKGKPVAGGERRSIDIIGARLHLTASGDDKQIASFFSKVKVFGSLDSDESVPVPRAGLDRTVKSDDAQPQPSDGPCLTIKVALTPNTRTSGHRKFRLEIDPTILNGAVHTWTTLCPLTYPSVDVRTDDGNVAATLYADAGNQQLDAKSGAAFTLSGDRVGGFHILVVGVANESNYYGIAEGWTQ